MHWQHDGVSMDVAIHAATDARATPFATLQDAHRDPVSSVAFAPNGQRLATGSYDRTAKLWSMTDGRCTGTFGKVNTLFTRST